MNDPYNIKPLGYDTRPDDPAPDPARDAPLGAPVSVAAPAPVPPGSVGDTSITCATCGYNLTGVAIGGTCPECGSRVDPSLGSAGKPAAGAAIASMVLGIISTVTSPMVCMCIGPVIGIPCGIAGLICWQLARKPIREGRVSRSSSGMNTAGLITSIIGLAIGLAFVALVVAMILLDSSSTAGFNPPAPVSPPTAPNPLPSSP